MDNHKSGHFWSAILVGGQTDTHRTFPLILKHTHRRAFVLDNFPFFSTLLLEFLGRCFQVDLTTDPAVTLLYRVAKVLACSLPLLVWLQYQKLVLSSSASSTLGVCPNRTDGVHRIW